MLQCRPHQQHRQQVEDAQSTGVAPVQQLLLVVLLALLLLRLLLLLLLLLPHQLQPLHLPHQFPKLVAALPVSSTRRQQAGWLRPPAHNSSSSSNSSHLWRLAPASCGPLLLLPPLLLLLPVHHGVQWHSSQCRQPAPLVSTPLRRLLLLLQLGLLLPRLCQTYPRLCLVPPHAKHCLVPQQQRQSSCSHSHRRLTLRLLPVTLRLRLLHQRRACAAPLLLLPRPRRPVKRLARMCSYTNMKPQLQRQQL